jgi:hypothetical protein
MIADHALAVKHNIHFRCLQADVVGSSWVGLEQKLHMAKDASKKQNGDSPARVAFDYIKGPHFRAVRADGAIGGVTPNGHIHIAFYSERLPIPRRVVHSLDPSSGKLGEEIARESRDAVIREMDSDLFLTLSVAKSIYTWLGERITELEVREELRKDKKKE